MRRAVQAVGERAVLIDCGSTADAHAVRAVLAAKGDPEVQDLVTGARTVLVRCVSRPDLAYWAGLVDAVPTGAATTGAPSLHTIDVRYDGEDLAEVAALTGLGVEGVIAAHGEVEWTAAFAGFAPGFVFLTGPDDRRLPEVPRRATPRTAVPAGAVGLAGGFSGVYPRRSPGGWQLIGRTDVRLWDTDRDPPALVRPGDRVRFRAVADLPEIPTPIRPVAAVPAPPALELLRTGMLCTVQDLGRIGFADLGVPRSGPADRAAAAAATAAVGNPPDAALLEFTLGGVRVRAAGPLLVVVTGAAGEVVRVRDGDRDPVTGVVALDDGDELWIGRPADGLRGYLAVQGGVSVPAVLGSRATDRLSGLGPAPLQPGDVLGVGAPGGRHPSAASGTALPGPGRTELAVLRGPRLGMFAPEAWKLLLANDYQVSPDSDRVGVRLAGGPVLPRLDTRELPSEGMVRGALEVPPQGLPVILGADGPVTGGYPVIGVLTEAAADLAGQLRPGRWVRFVETASVTRE